MKNNIYIILLFIMPAFMFACEEDEGVFTGPSDLFITGPGSVNPRDVKEYTLGDVLDPESYTWSVEGSAEIVGETTGSTVSVRFKDAGEAVLKVTNGAEDNGILNIEVANVEPAVTATFSTENTGGLGSGDKDTVFFEFAAPLAVTPTIQMNTDTSGFIADADAFVSGSISDLTKVSETKYYAIYTAGEGNGTPEALFSGLQATEEFGGLKLNEDGYAYVRLYEVDNVDPIVELTYSDELVNDSTVVTITATFSEPVTFRRDGTSGVDSAIYISLSGGGIEAERDTLQPTSDPQVYTYEFTANGEGNGTVTVDIENVMDMGRNPLSAITNEAVLVIDNVKPSLLVNNATDDGDYVTIEMASSEEGSGMYLVLEAGETPPTTPEEFMEAEGVESGSISLTASQNKISRALLDSGDYDVYYLVMDEAGNYSNLLSTGLTMD